MSDALSAVPPVNEVVNLLSRFNPAIIEKLKQEFHEQGRILERGIIAGADKRETAVKDDLRDVQDLKVRTLIAINGLRQAVEVCDRALPQTRERLGTSRKWVLYGHLCAIVGGASIFGTASQDSPTGSYIAATVTLLGSLASAYGQYLSESIIGKSGRLIDNYKNLVEAGAEARQALLALEEYNRAKVYGKDVDRLIRRANELCLVILSNAG